MDVARLARVSRGTVSNVLNGDPGGVVRPATAQRVRDAAAALGYVPSAAARLLRGASARFVLVLASSPVSHGVQGALVIDAIARELEARDLGLVQLTGHPRGLDPAGHLSPAVVLTQATVDDPEFAALGAGFRVPVLPVFPGRDAHISAAARAQVDFAAARGCDRVVYVGPGEPGLGAMSRLRETALASKASQRGISVVESTTLGADRDVWAAQAAAWRRRHGAGTLVCAFNDDVAVCVLAGAHDAGLAVPDDLAVIGADDSDAAARAVPALTSVRADLSEFVVLMADAIEAASNGRTFELPVLPSELHVTARDSTP